MQRIPAVKLTSMILILLLVTIFASKVPAQRIATSGKRPVNYVNTLVGTAPLDDPGVIGNAPPPGEELYTGMTLPGAMLPHGRAYLGPINRNRNLSYEAGRVHE